MLPVYPTAFWVCAVGAVLLIGIAKAGFGGGVGILALPLLALTVPVADAAALLLPLLMACDVFAVQHYRETFDKVSVVRLLPGWILGIGAGAFFFGYISHNARALEVGLGSLALVFGCFQVGRALSVGALQKRHPGRLEGRLLGAAAGGTATIAHAGAPPVGIYLLPQQLPRQVFVGTTVIFFAALNVLKVPPYWGLGLFTADILKTTLVLAPLAYAGVKTGIFLNARFTDRWFNRVIYALLAVTAVQLILGGSLLEMIVQGSHVD